MGVGGGYAAITVDLRKHGESVKQGDDSTVNPNDYQGMLLDLMAVKKFIFEEHQKKRLNMNKMGIVAVGKSAPVAAAYSEWDWKQQPYDDSPVFATRTPRGQDVRALIFLSPERFAGRVNATASLTYLRNPALNIALQVIVGTDDPLDKRQAQAVYDVFTATNKRSERSEIVSLPLKHRGMELVTDARVYANMLKFLDTQLKTVDSTWRDRRILQERN
jgi:hypothetical protein